MAKVSVLEVDQWTATGKVEELTLKDFEKSETLYLVKGCATGGRATAEIREVEEGWMPRRGMVWYKAGPDGTLVLFKANYDPD